MITNYMIDALKQCFMDWVTWHYSCQLATTITHFITFLIIICLIGYLAKKGIDNAEKS